MDVAWARSAMKRRSRRSGFASVVRWSFRERSGHAHSAWSCRQSFATSMRRRIRSCSNARAAAENAPKGVSTIAVIARALASRAISTLLLGTIVLDAPLSSQRASTPRVRPRPALTLESYARPDGAITVFADGSYVEPYFAMRALNTAADLGLDVDSLARRYIAWQLKQLGRGDVVQALLSGRRCFVVGVWRRGRGRCSARTLDRAAVSDCRANADARGLEAKRRGIPSRACFAVGSGRWCVRRIERTEDGTFHGQHRGVVCARDRGAKSPGRRRRRSTVSITWRGETSSRDHPRFLDRRTASYRISTQPAQALPRFYPEIVAQVFPAAFGYRSPAQSSKTLVAQWLRRHERDWVAQSDSGVAWGLVAVAAQRTGQRAAVGCWVARAVRMRSGAYWKCDEAIFDTQRKR